MATVTLQTNAPKLVLELRLAEAEVRNAAMPRALNRMIDQVRTATAKEIARAGYKLKASVIKSGLRVERATAANPRAAIVARGRPIPLIEYSARQTTGGVSVAVLNGRRVVKGTFIATMPTGHRGVYQREKGGIHKKVKANGRTSWHALPITELFGPKLPDGMANVKVQEALQRLVIEKFPAIFEHEVAWLRKRAR